MPNVDSFLTAKRGFVSAGVSPVDDVNSCDVGATGGGSGQLRPHSRARALGLLALQAPVDFGGQGLRAAEPVQLCGDLGLYRDPPIAEIECDRHSYRIGETLSGVHGWSISKRAVRHIRVGLVSAARHQISHRQPPFDLIVGGRSARMSSRLRSPAGLAAPYEAAGGVPLVAWDFHLALASFQIGVIVAGIDPLVCAGAALGPGFDTAGQTVAGCLEHGLDRLKVRP